MCSRYEDIPKRLVKYRQTLNKSQNDMCELLSVSQSQYCKLEKGNCIISYESLKSFKDNGGDIYYLITGKTYQLGILDVYMAKCNKLESKAEILKLLIWVTKQGLCKLNEDILYEVKNMWKYVSLAENEYKSENIWINIRKAEGLSQQCLAKILDIDVKRYRRLEKHKIYPDADILAALYQNLSYSPLLFFENSLFFPDCINRIWCSFPQKLQEQLIHLLDEGLLLVEKQMINEVKKL